MYVNDKSIVSPLLYPAYGMIQLKEAINNHLKKFEV